MVFVRVLKDNAYFKRFQVKPRRRREGKTDYKARRRLTQQANNKYNTPKYRFVVRITAHDVVCQVMYSKLNGDVCICAAYAHELSQFGAPVGHTNYAACYATGLLCARRLLTKLKLDSKYQGVKEADGKFDLSTHEKAQADQRPFVCVLDIGLAHSTTGARVFSALKGAWDGGLQVPHSPKRFVGSSKDGKFDSNVMRNHILGKHVGSYFSEMNKEAPEKAKTHFGRTCCIRLLVSEYRVYLVGGLAFPSTRPLPPDGEVLRTFTSFVCLHHSPEYFKANIAPDAIEKMWLGCHSKIRANPTLKKGLKKQAGPQKDFRKHKALSIGNRIHMQNQRRDKLRKKFETRKRLIENAGADSDEDDE